MKKNKASRPEVFKQTNCEKIVAYAALAVLLISLIPLMYVGRYNHPTGDDYYYGVETHQTWEETGSILKTVGAALEGVKTEYFRWQGTYSAMFLMYLPPQIFGDAVYGLVTTVILVLLTGGVFYLLKPLICRVANCSRSIWCIFASVISVLCVQTVPSQGETFFWYNGSMYYTGFFAVTLFFWGIICRYLLAPKRWHIPVMWLSAIFLAGGNYVSLLPCLILLLCLTFALACLKRKKETVVTGVTFLLMLLGLIVSAMAPGNQIRQSGMWKISAIRAILKSLLQGLNYTRAWIGVWWILAAIILLPFMWKSYSRMKYRFKYPILVIGFVYGIFCSMSCPLFYTMNSTGPARAVSIVYYAFILSTFFCYYYFVGYLHSVFMERRKQENSYTKRNSRRIITGIQAIVGVLLFAIAIYNGMINNISTVKAVQLLITGEAQGYHQEYLVRLDVLKDDSIKDVVFKPFENQPDMLYVGDFSGEPDQPTNQKVARYYKKQSVYVNYQP